jgi:serine-type D-ala-D-ala carboxypeptidase
MKKILYICLAIILLLTTTSLASTSFIWSDDSVYTSVTPTEEVDLNLESPSCILIEQTTGKILYEKNSHEQLRPASVTKVMSVLLIMEALDSGKISLTDKVPCSENASKMGGSQIWLDVREELTVDEMLKAICVVSANDCTVAMAEFLAGSTEAFVEKMNAKARELGMKDTCFKNCHGLDEDGHVTSSYDISLMSRELLQKHPTITKYTTIWTDTLRDGKSELTNTNKLIRNYKGATGLKTGSTGLALYNLSASATKNDLSLIAVIMKAPSTKVRFAEAQKLLDYGFNNYSYIQFAKKGNRVKSVPVNKGVESLVEVNYEQDSGCLLPKGKERNVEEIVNIPEYVNSPIQGGDKIGEVRYMLDGEQIGYTNLIAANTVKKINLSNMFETVFFSWFRVLR